MNPGTPDPKNNGSPSPAEPGGPIPQRQVQPQAAPTPDAPAPSRGAPVATVEAAPSEPLPNPLAHLPFSFQGVDHKAKGFDVEATVAPDEVVDAARALDAEGFALDTITGVDWMAQNQMEIVYDYFHPAKNLRAVVRTRVPRENPELPTVSDVYPGANWHERETHDFFGIRFNGHPDLSPFLLPEDADYHPLRKDFSA